MKIFVFLTLSLISLSGLNCESWDYKRHGPDEWHDHFSNCSGRMQSPIDLNTTIAKYNRDLKNVVFNNYNRLLTWNITNNGHSGTNPKKSKYFTENFI
jgi:carbonic anhydrase